MLDVQRYLIDNSLEALKKNFDIIVKKYDDRVVLNYSVKSAKFNRIIEECRGLVLSLPNYEVLCRSIL